MILIKLKGKESKLYPLKRNLLDASDKYTHKSLNSQLIINMLVT